MMVERIGSQRHFPMQMQWHLPRRCQIRRSCMPLVMMSFISQRTRVKLGPPLQQICQAWIFMASRWTLIMQIECMRTLWVLGFSVQRMVEVNGRSYPIPCLLRHTIWRWEKIQNPFSWQQVKLDYGIVWMLDKPGLKLVNFQTKERLQSLMYKQKDVCM